MLLIIEVSRQQHVPRFVSLEVIYKRPTQALRLLQQQSRTSLICTQAYL